MKQRSDGRWVKVKTIKGKKIFFYSTEKTEKQATRDIERQLLTYTERQTKGKLFREIAEEWKEEHQEAVTYKTWSGYKAHYDRAVQSFGDEPIREIETSDIQAYIKAFSLMQYAHKTVKAALNVLSLIFDKAIIEKEIKANPCAYVKIPSGLKQTPRELPNENEINKVIAGRDCHFGEFAYLLLFTGLRRGEALALTDKDIDFKQRVIHVTKSLYFESNRPKLKSNQTKAGLRDVFLLDNLIPILKEKKGYIFGGENPMTEQAFRRAWERYEKESGVTITPHQLRHAYATILHEHEIDVKTAQTLLGHADAKTTMDIYTHITESKKQAEFEKLNSWSKEFKK